MTRMNHEKANRTAKVKGTKGTGGSTGSAKYYTFGKERVLCGDPERYTDANGFWRSVDGTSHQIFVFFENIYDMKDLRYDRKRIYDRQDLSDDEKHRLAAWQRARVAKHKKEEKERNRLEERKRRRHLEQLVSRVEALSPRQVAKWVDQERHRNSSGTPGLDVAFSSLVEAQEWLKTHAPESYRRYCSWEARSFGGKLLKFWDW